MKKNGLTKLLVVAVLITCLCPLYPSRSNAGTITDNFDGASINSRLWWVPPYHADQNQRCLQQGGVLKIQIDGVSQGEGYFGAGLGTCFDLKGDFEIIVDYNLTNWPYSNGVGAGIGFFGTVSPGNGQGGQMTRRSYGADEPQLPTNKENYVSDFMDGNYLDHAEVLTSDSQGGLRLTRVGKVMTGYYRKWVENVGWHWEKLGSHDYTDTGLDDWLMINLSAGSSTATRIPNGQLVHPFAGKDVEIDFDNWQVTYDQIRYPSSQGLAPGSLILLLFD